jgi:hypothetical protein
VDSVLTDIQRRFLETFFTSGPISTHFYLSGGTALAGFYLHHRLSDDIDLFTRDVAQIKRARERIEASITACALEITARREIEEERREYLEYKLQGDPHPTHPLRKIDVVRDTDPIFSPPELYGVIRVDSLLNIAVNKVAAIFSRSDEAKDYVDLYFILKTQPFDLDALLPMAAQKDLGFDELRFAASLAGVSGLGRLVPFLERYMVKPLRVDDLVRFCEETAARIFDRHPPRG